MGESRPEASARRRGLEQLEDHGIRRRARPPDASHQWVPSRIGNAPVEVPGEIRRLRLCRGPERRRNLGLEVVRHCA